MDDKIESLEIDEVVEKLKTNINSGLSTNEANERVLKYGKNELKEKKKKSVFKIFIDELKNPMIYILFVAIGFTIIVSIYETVKCIKNNEVFSFTKTGDWPDVIIILIVILLNALIGTVEEVKAITSLENLKKLSSPKATVVRDGKTTKINSEDLTIGDIVILEDGDTICADLRLVKDYNLKVNESSLTGESLPVLKKSDVVLENNLSIADRVNCCYASTNVAYGRGVGVVYSVGMNTEIGKIAGLISDDENEKSPLQITLAKLSKLLGIITLAIVGLVFIIEILWMILDGQIGDLSKYIEIILSAISLAVAAVPEGLQAVVTIVLALGVQKMVKANTIVRKLNKIEALGAVNVICSDKTGTLTQNIMTVVEAYTFDSFYSSDTLDYSNLDIIFLAKGFCLASNAKINDERIGDPTELALVDFAKKLNMDKDELENISPRVDELPFDSIRKMMSTRHSFDNKSIVYTKGALDSVLAVCNRIKDNNEIREITDVDKEKIYLANNIFTSKALRVLALAFSNDNVITENNLIFVGLVAMIDPPRKEAIPAIDKLNSMGIKTVMITGDHKDTAYQVAKQLGICSSYEECITGKELDILNDDELVNMCKKVKVFARVSPENKVQIVKAFKKLGNVCAMTGDGVNDAPSLKSADIGIAMGITGTDVAKESADMVLADDNFASIELAVEEGRGIYSNIRKTVYFLLGSNMAEVFSMLFLILLGLPAPLIAIHLLWVNLITDSLPAVSLGVCKKDESILSDKPRKKDESIFANGGFFLTFGYGIIVTIAVVLAYFSCGFMNNAYTYFEIKELYNSNSNILHQAQTMAFTTLAFSELFHMLGMSNIERSVFKIYKSKNILLLFAFILGVLLQIFVVKVPFASSIFNTYNLDYQEWLVTILLSLLPLLVHEIIIIVKKIKAVKKINSESL